MVAGSPGRGARSRPGSGSGGSAGKPPGPGLGLALAASPRRQLWPWSRTASPLAEASRRRPTPDRQPAGTSWLRKLSALARAMQDEKGLEHTLDAIVLSAADTVPGAD